MLIARRAAVAAVALLLAPACASPGAAGPAARTDVDDPAPTAPSSFVLTSTSGEASRDASRTTSTWAVEGGRVRVAVRYAGRDEGQPGHEPQDAEGDVADIEAVLAQASAASAQIPPGAPAPELVDVTYRELCIERAGERRCAWQVGDAPADDAFRALASLESRLTTYVVLGP